MFAWIKFKMIYFISTTIPIGNTKMWNVVNWKTYRWLMRSVHRPKNHCSTNDRDPIWSILVHVLPIRLSLDHHRQMCNSILDYKFVWQLLFFVWNFDFYLAINSWNVGNCKLVSKCSQFECIMWNTRSTIIPFAECITRATLFNWTQILRLFHQYM